MKKISKSLLVLPIMITTILIGIFLNTMGESKAAITPISEANGPEAVSAYVQKGVLINSKQVSVSLNNSNTNGIAPFSLTSNVNFISGKYNFYKMGNGVVAVELKLSADASFSIQSGLYIDGTHLWEESRSSDGNNVIDFMKSFNVGKGYHSVKTSTWFTYGGQTVKSGDDYSGQNIYVK
ncbi:hypothetical protein [Companilactobacillus furfuricola]|uniref:hypothetical protein n=1 Tax=Companilactobacillus furfuricola TaxID=1462575 RepID=UPI000F7AAA8F|nr:hypothetical protein [Companilactobacillus furfuricola]